MKGLIYPLTGLAVIAVVSFLTAAVVMGVNDARRKHAIRHAKWEPFAEINDAGRVVFGVQLVARWGRHRETQRRHPRTETVDADDLNLIARIEALSRAQTRAQSYNDTLTMGNEQR